MQLLCEVSKNVCRNSASQAGQTIFVAPVSKYLRPPGSSYIKSFETKRSKAAGNLVFSIPMGGSPGPACVLLLPGNSFLCWAVPELSLAFHHLGPWVAWGP